MFYIPLFLKGRNIGISLFHNLSLLSTVDALFVWGLKSTGLGQWSHNAFLIRGQNTRLNQYEGSQPQDQQERIYNGSFTRKLTLFS